MKKTVESCFGISATINKNINIIIVFGTKNRTIYGFAYSLLDLLTENCVKQL